MRLIGCWRRGSAVVRELCAADAHVLDCFARSGDDRRYRGSVLASTDREHDLRGLDQIVELLREGAHVLSPRIPTVMRENENGCVHSTLASDEVIKADLVKVTRQKHDWDALEGDLDDG